MRSAKDDETAHRRAVGDYAQEGRNTGRGVLAGTL